LGLQNGISFALRAVGVNDVLAEAIAIGTSSFLFAQAHTTVLESAEFSSTMISGAIYGAIQSLGGFHEAALAHVLFDSTIHINLNNIRDYIPFMRHHAE
jgi:membrane protease YdiL (CAAX protease family)